MYREGILPSGKPMSATRPDGSALSGTAFTCVGCHLRAGTGNTDETGVTPSITAPRLFQARFRYYSDLTLQERTELLPEAARTPLRRPAYTEASLIAAIRTGVDSAGQPLNPVMPRYRLTDREGDLLVGYLKTLSLEPSPGATETTLSFATVVGEGVPRGDREAMLATLQQQVAAHNQVYEKSLKRAYRLVSMKEMALPLRRWSLATWELKGAPATWPAQLEEYQKAAPVFALVGGMTTGDWRPVHEFCERRGLPCILPLTDFPVVAPVGGYTVYFSGGFYQEGATAGTRVADSLEDTGGKAVLQITQDTLQGRELSRGFQDALTKRGLPKAREVVVPAEGLSGPFLANLLKGIRGEATLVLWAGREAYAALEAVAASETKPARVLMSASYLGEDLWDLPEGARSMTALTYPYRLAKPVNPGEGSTAPAPLRPAPRDEHRVRSRAYTLMQVVDEGVRRMGRDFYRDNLLDRIGLMEDKKDSDFQVLRFGTAQPWLSTGSSWVQVSPGPLRALVDSADRTLR
jgi:ABC-type branched-subunit amino acid transport system substrate-binding protein